MSARSSAIDPQVTLGKLRDREPVSVMELASVTGETRRNLYLKARAGGRNGLRLEPGPNRGAEATVVIPSDAARAYLLYLRKKGKKVQVPGFQHIPALKSRLD